MRRIGLFFIAVLAGCSLLATTAQAQVDFFIEAEIPAADGATFTVSKVLLPSETFQKQAAGFTALDFGMLSLDTATGIFVPSFFWVIDVGSNGAGFPDLEFAYTDTNNPNGTNNDGTGLGGHGTVSYSEVVDNGNGTQTVNLVRGEALQDADGATLDETETANGFARISFGIATGNASLQEGTAVPFTSADKNGTYSGTYTITATFDIP